ncbi:uncharacterized protein IUM83_16465 [Phytophthora cinnamomi]|uniref:uncharacterized protein n=1 Tax=Phytophthora cinnamomi TaxID=4785 RepID=UPI003559B66D|nr:hypothetical protein IUM83_16465 [Phytophthora cinnamomi]
MKAAARQRHRVHSNALAVKMQVDSTEASTEWFRKIADARRGPGGHFAPADLEARPRTSVCVALPRRRAQLLVEALFVLAFADKEFAQYMQVDDVAGKRWV